MAALMVEEVRIGCTYGCTDGGVGALMVEAQLFCLNPSPCDPEPQALNLNSLRLRA